MISPIKNLEYGSYGWLVAEIGNYLQMNYDSSTWDHNDKFKVNSIIQSGYQQFCFPAPLSRMVEKTEGDSTERKKEALRKAPHQWTFLNPISEIEFAADQDTFTMPKNFAHILGDLTNSDGRVSVVGEAQLRSVIAQDPKSGTPEYVALRPNNKDWEMIVYPKPDEDKTYSYRYTIKPEPLGEENQTPLGGIQHADTLLHSCLVVAAEREGKDVSLPFERYQDRLSASIHLDKMAASATEDQVWESTQRNTLDQLIGIHLGYPANRSAWTRGQELKVKEAIRQGKRMFYNPAILDGDLYSHDWSFLKIVADFDLLDGVSEYDLPEDFAGLDSPITYTGTQQIPWPEIKIVGEHQVRQQLQLSNISSRPKYGATRAKTHKGPTQYELIVYPTPDTDYNVKFQYRVDSETDDFVLGGNEHFQTILYACKVAADEMDGAKKSPSYDRFIERLKVSVSIDRKQCPPTMGYNHDRSDLDSSFFYDGRWHQFDSSVVLYNGTSP